MSYRVFLKRSAEKEVEAFRSPLFDRIKRKLFTLEKTPRPYGVQKLQGQEVYRIRIGDYRILYVIDDSAKRIDVISIAHRREAYR